MKITTAWLFGMGLKMGMRVKEILISTPGEIVDLCSCYAIASGAKEKGTLTFDELLEMK